MKIWDSVYIYIVPLLSEILPHLLFAIITSFPVLSRLQGKNPYTLLRASSYVRKSHQLLTFYRLLKQNTSITLNPLPSSMWDQESIIRDKL